jgi:hypothetical protein
VEHMRWRKRSEPSRGEAQSRRERGRAEGDAIVWCGSRRKGNFGRRLLSPAGDLRQVGVQFCSRLTRVVAENEFYSTQQVFEFDNESPEGALPMEIDSSSTCFLREEEATRKERHGNARTQTVLRTT